MMELWVAIAAVAIVPLAIIFGDDLRKLRRIPTIVFDSARDKRRKARKWYVSCAKREFAAAIVNNPEEATAVFIESLIDSDKIVCWSTQIAGGGVFRLGVIWKYRGFWMSLGSHAFEDGDDWTWAVVPPRAFLSVSGHALSLDSHWTGSALIDAATTYVDGQIEEAGVADYRPPWRYRAVQRLRNFLSKPRGLWPSEGGLTQS